MNLIWPLEAPLSQEFGAYPNSIQPNGHTGRDYAVANGTDVHAIGSGTVIWADWASKLSASNPWWIAPAYAGICVLVDHGGLVSVYAHLNETLLNPGETVAQGQVIGKSGTTGLATGPHLHFEVFGWPLQPYNGFYGRLDPRGVINGQRESTGQPDANQRIVGQFGVIERTAPDSGAQPTGRTFLPGDGLTFKGYVRAATPTNGTNVWFVGALSGHYFSASAFDDQGTHDLPDLTPAPPAAAPLLGYQRQVADSPVNYRTGPSTSAPLKLDGGTGQLDAGKVYDFKGFVKAENRTWFVGKYSGGYAAAEFFTDSGTHDLPDLTPPATTTPAPAPVYDFAKAFDFVEKMPAGIGNFQAGNFPKTPTHAVCHWWNRPEVNPSIAGVIAEFQRAGSQKSAHFVVSGKRIIQMIALTDRAYHASTTGNDWIGIEIDPRFDPDTIASVKKLLAALRDKYGIKLTLILHKDVPGNATSCSELDLAKLEIEVIPPAPPITPDPVAPAPSDDLPAVRRFLDWLYTLYSNSLKGK